MLTSRYDHTSVLVRSRAMVELNGKSLQMVLGRGGRQGSPPLKGATGSLNPEIHGTGRSTFHSS